jgi:hypothetical protein
MELTGRRASFRGETSVSRKLLGALQMVYDLRQSLARELLQLWIVSVLDLLFEQRRIALLILDLAIHIIPVERSATVRRECVNHRVIGAVQKRARRRDIFLFQDHIQRIDDWNVGCDHQMGVTADRCARGLCFRQPAGVDLERRAQIRLTDKIEIHCVEGRRYLRRGSGLRTGDGSAGRLEQNAS